MPLQQGSMSDMTDVRSYTNGHGRHLATGPKAQSSDFVNALQDAVRENPISAALIGMGVLWMFMGGSNTSLFGGAGRKSIFRTAAQRAEQAGGAVRDTASHVGSSASHVTNAAAETASQVAGGVREASSRAAGQAVDAAASAYDSSVNAASRAAETISNATTNVARSVQETGTKWGSTVQQNIADTFERQPLLLGAVGLAIGAGIAASIPITEAEKKVMGEASDFVRETVTDKAAQVKEMANTAVNEAKAQGLTPEAASGALRTIGDKVASVAQTAASTSSSTKETSQGSKKS
jgi:uncharacterized protein YukE